MNGWDWRHGAALAVTVALVATSATAQDVDLEERATIEGWVKLLGDEKSDVRQKAADALRAIGEPARPFLEAALASESAEVRTSAQRVLDGLVKVRARTTGTDLVWAGLRGNAQRSGVAGGDLPATEPEEVWKARIVDIELLQGSVVPGEDRVACLSESGTVRCYAASDGHRLWLADVDAKITASAVLAGGRLVIPTSRGLTALDLETGRKTWSHEAKYGCDAAPAVYGGTVYAAFNNDGVRSFRLDGGAEVMHAPLAPRGALLVDGDLLVVGTEDGALIRIDPVSGKRLWRKDIGSAPNMGPTLAAPGVIMVMAENRYLRAISADRGRVLWERRLTSASRSESLAAAAGRVFLSDRRGALLAFDAGSGRSLWVRHEGMSEIGGPCATGSRVLWGARGRMRCRDAKTGDTVWRIDLPEYRCAVPSARGGRIYVLSDQYLRALE